MPPKLLLPLEEEDVKFLSYFFRKNEVILSGLTSVPSLTKQKRRLKSELKHIRRILKSLNKLVKGEVV